MLPSNHGKPGQSELIFISVAIYILVFVCMWTGGQTLFAQRRPPDDSRIIKFDPDGDRIRQSHLEYIATFLCSIQLLGLLVWRLSSVLDYNGSAMSLRFSEIVFLAGIYIAFTRTIILLLFAIPIKSKLSNIACTFIVGGSVALVGVIFMYCGL